MKKLRKTENCLNCGLVLDKKYNYCPQCGQENTNNKASVRVLAWDTILNYFSFDMLFGRSLLPFLFRPGYLVSEFLEGSRVGHIHPVRLYLVLNFLFFLIFVKTINLQTIEQKLTLTENNNKSQLATKVFIYAEKDTIEMSLREFADSLNMDRHGLKGDSLAQFLVQEIAKQKIPLKYELKKEPRNDDIITVGNIFSDGGKNTFNWQKMIKHIGRKDISPTNFLDSIGWKNKSPRSLKAAGQALKIGRNDLSIFILNIISNIPTMMILMLPLIALYLKLFYIFSKRLYIEHLVFTFHFQSFLYFGCGLALLISNWGMSEESIIEILVGGFIITLIYNYLMLKNVYKQSWWLTIFKLFLLFWAYIITFFVFFVGEMAYSFFTY